MSQFLTNAINPSPTIAAPAGEKITGGGGKAVKFDENGNITLCDTAGEKILGIITIDNDDIVEVGDDVSVQIKDGGVARLGGDCTYKDELTTDANGAFVKAAAGQAVRAIALSSGGSGALCRVMMCNYTLAPSSSQGGGQSDNQG